MNDASKYKMLNAVNAHDFLEDHMADTYDNMWKLAILDAILAIAYTVCGDPELPGDEKP